MSVTELNTSQWEAVNCLHGPLLVLAGPGSGKTRVISRRIVRLIEEGVAPGQILAITFTNKAAGEMASRVESLLPGRSVWVSTFHRLCARLLHRDAAAVGLAPNFTILDTADQAQLVKGILTDLNADSKHFKPGRILHRIGQAKYHLQTPEMFAAAAQERRGDQLDQLVSRVYAVYEEMLLKANAVDFDDLLMHVCRLLSENDEIRAELDHRYRYIMVDEYQDTNLPQYQIVRALSQDYPNLCATGDPDQSIYGWRGAEIGNILRFEHDFPNVRVVRLEQNYRSTKAILRAADSLIGHNLRRKEKSLFTENPEGEPVEHLSFDDHRQEAEGVVQALLEVAAAEQRPWSDFAIFYRINALSRELERALARNRVPYQVAAGVAFYERAEIKDLLAYLRLIHNPADRAAFLRVVNTPARGIGKGSVAKLADWADRQGSTLLEAARHAAEFPGLSARGTASLRRFVAMIDELARSNFGGIAELVDAILERTHYGAEWRGSDVETDIQRAANIDELRNAAAQYDQQHADDPTLAGFLEETALVADVDSIDETAGAVTLMTLHAAKGLEFPVVFIIAVEDGLLPHERATREGARDDIEEERRLLFVGTTRAEERLFLTRANVRTMHGKDYPSPPSRFLQEMQLSFSRCVVADHTEDGDDEAEDTDADELSANQRRADRDAAEATGDPEDADAVNTDGARPAAARQSRREAKRHRTPGGSLLTTGADLLNGTSKPADFPLTFTVGMTVRHPQLGLGRVLEAQGTGKWRTVTVEFQSGESVSFVVHKCPLQPVGAG
jgi:DNA helicase-2/ATP-dependent DNA helicase PcrA